MQLTSYATEPEVALRIYCSSLAAVSYEHQKNSAKSRIPFHHREHLSIGYHLTRKTLHDNCGVNL
ncbi:hypothetical protein BH10ACI4_BH10ACI4_25890 [soil metagenome]